MAEVIEDGVTGFVVDHMDQAIDAARRVHTLDRRACRDAFVRRFRSRMASEYVRLYESSLPVRPLPVLLPHGWRRRRSNCSINVSRSPGTRTPAYAVTCAETR